MEKFISQNNLEQFYKKEIGIQGRKTVEEQIQKVRNDGSKHIKSIFLSHSHLDKTIVNKISLLFSNLNINIYIDWLDKSLPEQTDRITASVIKSKIHETNHFLFLATYHGLRSKWCNWELGIADSFKNNEKLAILPIETKSGNWRGNEYLHLYPEMRFGSDNLDDLTVEKIKIHQLDGKIISFEDWLK
ncbi:toll/interleukin-1 receptor domain-containing protein [uncultured Flavobacterium sp.]|uniref:toll/interleukin-1 receptor domain-containing protein n=1 Tax=uncultured Flavobacterium sp. TaxID=165435 RepID=UPI002931B9D2|nr:toll/interleukin-1 receptor domain-containing protein [uncultured Flavobacterium sp.]